MMTPEEFLKAEEVWVHFPYEVPFKNNSCKAKPVAIEVTSEGNAYVVRLMQENNNKKKTFYPKDVYKNEITENDILKIKIIEEQDKLNKLLKVVHKQREEIKKLQDSLK